MKNKNSFENILKTKMEALEKLPSPRVKQQLLEEIQIKTGKIYNLSVILIAAASLLLIGIIYSNFPTMDSTKYSSIQEGITPHLQQEHHDHPTVQSDKPQKTMITMTPQDIKTQYYLDALEKAGTENKLIVLYAYKDDCSYCKKMQESTFLDPSVQEFLEEHFIKLDIELKDIKRNIEVIQFYNIKIVPKFIFLNKRGQLIFEFNGSSEPDKFIENLEYVLEKEATGEYQKLGTGRIVNKANLPKNLTATVFPNPTNGAFKVTVKGTKEAVTVNIIDLNGKSVSVKSNISQKDSAILEFDLTGRSGQYIIQIRQGKEMISKKVIIL